MLFLFFLTDLQQQTKARSQNMPQYLKPQVFSQALWKELAQSLAMDPLSPLWIWMERSCEPPCLRQPPKQVTVIVLLGVFLGKVFQVPLGELLLRENNDYFREVFSVNNIPQVSVFQLL